MLSFFVVIASFKEVDEPAVQYANWRAASYEQCEERLKNLLWSYKIDYDVHYIKHTERRSFTVEGLAPKFFSETRLNCVEVAP
jgi:hypothetical protein